MNLTDLQSKNKIWVVSELFYPETISTAYIMTEIAKSLSTEYKVEIICGSIFYEKKAEHSVINDFDFAVNRINDVTYNKNNFISRLLGNLQISWKIFLLMKKKIPSNSEVLMVSNPIFLVLLTSLIVKKRCWSIKLLVHDVFPENLTSVKNAGFVTKLILPILKNIFNRAFSKMNTLILLGRDMKDIFSKKVKNVNIKIIENWSDTENISPFVTNELNCVFLYAGNFGRVQGLDDLISALSKIKSSNFKFLFVGSGAYQKKIDFFIENSVNKNIEKQPWQPRESQNKFLNTATVGVVTLASEMYGLGVPSKFYNLLAAGKPILYIGPINSELHLVIKENNIGWFVESGNIQEISNTFEKIINTDLLTFNEYSINARKLAETKYEKHLILNKFNKLFSLENIN
jgi:glycosyltransferase involved in cell wall biosynthesis